MKNKKNICLKRILKTRPSYSIIARNKRLVGRWNMLEKMIELTNEYIESMPKKERKKYGQFLQVWRLLVLWQLYII